MTAKVTSVLPLNWVSPKRKAHCSEERHETMGLGPQCCHPFTVGLMEICLTCQIKVILCECISKENRKVPARNES